MRCKCCLSHLHATHMLFLHQIKPIDSRQERREAIFPGEVAQHVRSPRVFPCDDAKVRFTSPEKRLCEAWVCVSSCVCVCVCVCVCAASVELAGCCFAPGVTYEALSPSNMSARSIPPSTPVRRTVPCLISHQDLDICLPTFTAHSH